MVRIFTQKENIKAQEIIIDDKEDIHHIGRVLRLKEGAVITVSTLDGWEYEAGILSMSQNEVRAEILDKSRNSREPELKITLFQSIPKQGKIDVIIQKSVELGVGAIVPVITARTIGKPGGKTERWQKISEEAAKQCRRGAIPLVSKEVSFSEMTSMLGTDDFGAVIFAYENEENNSIKDVLLGFKKKPQTLAIIIGPEGGFSEDEARALELAGALPASLGKTVLRTETAGPAAIAMIMYELEL